MVHFTPVPYPPTITTRFSGAPAPPSPTKNIEFFLNFRNEHMSRISSHDPINNSWNALRSYAPESSTTIKPKEDKFLKLPKSLFTMLDEGRQQEIDNFYMVCQMHRDQYKDRTGSLHALDYFKTDCDAFRDCTSRYLETPIRYIKYKDPAVSHFQRKAINYPKETLVGTYDVTSDVRYKR